MARATAEEKHGTTTDGYLRADRAGAPSGDRNLRFDALLALEHITADIGRRRGLSARQLDTLVLLTKGLSNKEIASKLGIDYRTAAEHVARTCRKFSVADRDELRSTLTLALLEFMATARAIR